ncbi:MAG: DNA repair protein RadC [Candidatus Omnitrophica bacterium]|nr:DNA repair protein RadC [Candidatus Omnitrophota bacterium]
MASSRPARSTPATRALGRSGSERPHPSTGDRAALTIRDLPLSERPRERLTQLGAEALSEHELLACLLGRGVAGESVLISARRLLSTFGTLRGMFEASVEQLSQVHGIGPAKAAQLKAAIELARRMALPAHQRPPRVIESAEAAAELLRPRLVEKKKEHFVAILLDARHRVIRISPIAVGSLSATLVHPRELFKEAVAASAAAVIVAHNHPSGDPEPSAQDVQITKRLVEAGALLGIEVLDHLIIGADGLVSLRAAGVIRDPAPSRTGRSAFRSSCHQAAITP